MSSRALAKNNWPIQQVAGLPLIFSPLLSELPFLVHAFTTRRGGTSLPPLDSFNLGRHVGNEASRADAMFNRQRLCAALALNVNRLVVPGQVHSTNIAWVTEPEKLPSVDGVATVTPETPVLLHYADCVPIIIADSTLGIMVVLHAGWRGTAGGIAGLAVRLITKSLELEPRTLSAAIGPAIGSCCYPTGDDVSEKLLSTVENKTDLVEWKDGKPHPDLKAINAMQLLEAGVGQVDVAAWCTCCNPELFYSHRQSGGKTGRQSAIAALLPRPGG